MRTKKELLEIVLVFVIGVIFILLLALNVKQYEKRFPTQTNHNIEKGL